MRAIVIRFPCNVDLREPEQIQPMATALPWWKATLRRMFPPPPAKVITVNHWRFRNVQRQATSRALARANGISG
jgi:hypothetical protein